MQIVVWIVGAGVLLAGLTAHLVRRRSRTRDRSVREEAGRTGAVDLEALERELAEAKTEGNPERIEEIETRLRVERYWERKREPGSHPDDVPEAKKRARLGDDEITSKRFNNFR